MNSTELFDLFRTDIVDVALPYLWSDDEVWRYMNDAYFMFVRLTGGIPDYTSDATIVPVTAGEKLSPLNSSILRVVAAHLASDGRPLTIINPTDLPTLRDSDYGQVRPMWLDTTPGPVRYMLIGAQQHTCQWLQVPIVNDEVNLLIQRLPLSRISGDSQEFIDVNEEHHFHFLLWMKKLAYMKQDAETFDRTKSGDNDMAFRNYCAEAKAELERKKHKTRVVSYGGL